MEASKPPLPNAAPISNDSQESGLWLWRGETPQPPPMPPVPSPSRIERVAARIIAAARSARWLAPPTGLALISLAAWVSLDLLAGIHSMPGKTSVAALSSAPPPGLARQIIPTPPPPLAEAPLDQVPAQSAPVTQAMTEPTQRTAVNWRARHKLPLTARRSHLLYAHRWTPVFDEQCRYHCDWAEAGAWHGGGY